jgi:hypothetical protein
MSVSMKPNMFAVSLEVTAVSYFFSSLQSVITASPHREITFTVLFMHCSHELQDP